MQRRLPGLQHQVDGPALVDRVGVDRLVVGEHVARAGRLAVRQDGVVGPGNHPHAPVFGVGIVDGDPQRDGIGRLEPPVGRVLMPGHELVDRPGRLREESRGDQDHVRADRRPRQLQHPRMVHEFPEGLVFQMLLRRPGRDVSRRPVRLDLLVDEPIPRHLRAGQHVQRRHIALAFEPPGDGPLVHARSSWIHVVAAASPPPWHVTTEIYPRDRDRRQVAHAAAF
jgi:hypothetical protein